MSEILYAEATLTERYQNTVPAAHPDRLQAVAPALRDRIDALVGDMDVDLNEALSEEDE